MESKLLSPIDFPLFVMNPLTHHQATNLEQGFGDE
jgi:hypothetical protein